MKQESKVFKISSIITFCVINNKKSPRYKASIILKRKNKEKYFEAWIFFLKKNSNKTKIL